jgi:hypothetical protein
VLHPLPSSSAVVPVGGDLLFQQCPLAHTTRAVFRERVRRESRSFGGCYVVIQYVECIGLWENLHLAHHANSHDGNLDSSPERRPLYEFAMPAWHGPHSDTTLELGHSLELAVGENGVIGRRVTVHRRERDGQIIAEGVIGWN